MPVKSVRLKSVIRSGALLLIAACVAGCCGQSGGGRMLAQDDSFKLPKKIAGASDSERVRLRENLEKKGVRVISIGQDYLISLPSSRVFADQSPHIPWGSYALLNEVVEYLQQFRKVAVNVTSYSSKYISAKRERALTLARAKKIANYLWSQGIDSRFIFSEGAGSDKPVVSYYKGGDMSPNSRIEITFRDAVA